MKKSILTIALCAATAVLVLNSCGSIASYTRSSQYPKMYESKPVTLLVMPPINNTTSVDAKEYLYTSISRPLAEAGYYVISPTLAMDVLKAESAYDAELFVDKPLTTFQKFFGVDAVVFSEINSWTKAGFGIRTDLHYFIRSAYTGEILFERNCNLYMDLSVDAGSNSLLSNLVSLAASAINTATTEHITAARAANYYIFTDIPRGKYSPDYQKDQDYSASAKNITANVK